MEMLVVCKLTKMDGIFKSNRIEGLKSEKWQLHTSHF